MAAVALAAAISPGAAAAKIPLDKLTADPTGDFLAECKGAAHTEGPAAMDMVGATALVDPYGDLWLVAQVDGDPQAYLSTNPRRAAFTWDVHDRTDGRHIQVLDELRDGKWRLDAVLEGESVSWPVERIYEGRQLTMIVTGVNLGDNDVVLWGATTYASDPAGMRCDQVGGGATPSLPVSEGIGGSGDGASASTAPPGTTGEATTAASSSARSANDTSSSNRGGDGDKNRGGTPALAVAIGIAVVLAGGATAWWRVRAARRNR